MIGARRYARHRPMTTASIVIDCYQYGRFVGAAIESALAQTVPVEGVVVDDGSTDESREVIARYDVRVIFQANGGQAAALQAGIAACTGEVVLLLDADDLAAPERAARVVSAMDAHPRAGFCFHALEYVDEVGAPAAAKPARLPAGAIDARAIIRAGGRLPLRPPATSGLALRRSLLDAIGPLPPELRILADNYLKIVALGRVPGVVLAETLGAQRLHGANAHTGLRDERERARRAFAIARCLGERHPELAAYAHRIALRAAGRLAGHHDMRAALADPVVRDALARAPLRLRADFARLFVDARLRRYAPGLLDRISPDRAPV